MASGDELAPFVLANVEGLHDSSQEREKGAGAYGVVYKVSVNGMPCIAKRLHAILTREVSRQEKDSVQAKFRNECIMLSKLQHPNIVHFVGVCYGKSVEELSLIMECLHTDLDQYLETKPNIPLPDKLSILLDVSYGLLYLHTSNPPIIHRDLTAPNILLTKGLRAKIADLGVSKLLSSRSLSAHTQTKGPGQILYMPPEALLEYPKYDSKLDVFSFGHLAIFVSSQEFPKVYEVTTRHAVLAMEQGNLQVLKRQKSLDAVGQDHCLYPLIRQCLMDDPERRPSTSELNKYLVQLESKSSEVELSYCQQLKIARTAIVRLKEHSKEQSKAILELKQHQLSEMTQESLIAENAGLRATLCQLEKERDGSLLKLEDEKAKMTQEDAVSLQRMVEDLEKENWQLRERLIALNENVELLERDKQQLQVEFGHLQVSTSRLGSLSAENTELRSTLGQLRKERDNALSLLEDEKAKKQQPPNVGEGHTDGDGGSLNALDAALKYNDVLNRKSDQLMKKLADVKMNSSNKDREISRLKAQLAGSSESGHLMTSHDPRTVLPHMSPTEAHRGIKQTVDHQAILIEAQTENTMLRTKVADLEIRVKSMSSTDIGRQIGAKDTEIDELKEEIEQLKAVAGRFEPMNEHSRGQSKEVLELKVKLQQSGMTQEDAESLQRVVEDLEKENWQLQELRSTLGQLRKERDNALSLLEDEKAKALTFKLDFEEERSDRERAHSIIGELEKQIMHKSSRTTHELETLKTTLASAEVLKSDYRKKLRDNMASANAEIRRLREELDGRTSQVKQFVKQTAQLKSQLEHATKNIAKLSEEMDKWRKKAKKAPKKHKRDPGGVESDLYGEIEALHTENESLTQQMEAMRALNKTFQDMLQQAVRKTSTYAEPNAQTPVMSPEDHQTNEQKVPSHDQQPAKQAAKDDEIRQHLREQFQQPSPLPHPVSEKTPAAGPGQWMSPQTPKAVTPHQSEQGKGHSYQNRTYGERGVLPGEQAVGSKEPITIDYGPTAHAVTVTDSDAKNLAPFDPNLVCPMCMKPFRIGEIQKFRKHILDCNGPGDV